MPLLVPTLPSNLGSCPSRPRSTPTRYRGSPTSVGFPLPKVPSTSIGATANENATRSWQSRSRGRRSEGRWGSLRKGGQNGCGAAGQRAETARRFVTVTRALTSSGECTREEALFYARLFRLLSFYLIPPSQRRAVFRLGPFRFRFSASSRLASKEYSILSRESRRS